MLALRFVCRVYYLKYDRNAVRSILNVYYKPPILITKRSLCSGFNDNNNNNKEEKHKERVREELKSYLKQHRVRLRDTEERIKKTSNVIIKDIKETKEKVKERVGEIIEVCGDYSKYVKSYFKLLLCSPFFRKKMYIQYQIYCVFRGFYYLLI